MFNFPAICKKYGWDMSKLCGPTLLAINQHKAEDNCPLKHTKGGVEHGQQPKVAGKPFEMTKEIFDTLKKEGLISFQQELKDEREAGTQPPGQPTKNRAGALVWPARHFA